MRDEGFKPERKKPLQFLARAFHNFGSSTWARTRDLRINSPALYQLSYRGILIYPKFNVSMNVEKSNLKQQSGLHQPFQINGHSL
jgi:hypothetical protein